MPRPLDRPANFFAQDRQVRLLNVKLVSAFSLLKLRYSFALIVFLQKFIVLENSICSLFTNDVHWQLHDIFVANTKMRPADIWLDICSR